MAQQRRRLPTYLAMSTLTAGNIAGCHNATVCEPTTAAMGQVVSAAKSEIYQAQIDRAGGDVPHLGCRADTTIPTAKAYLGESEDSACDTRGVNCVGAGAVVNPILQRPSANVHMAQGEFRVLGIGHGIEQQDCGLAALVACNQGVDAYFKKVGGVRPPMIQCRLADIQHRCSAGTAKARATTARAPTEPVASAADAEPSTWLGRLGDAKARPVAIRALVHFFNDAMGRANRDLADPAVKALLDQIVLPMTSTYVDGNLERSTRIVLVKFLADTRDPRAGSAYLHACHGFANGTGPDEEDVHHVAPAIGAMKYAEAAPAIGAAFAKLEAGTNKGGAASKNVYGAMLQLNSPAWKPMLLEKIGRPLQRPGRAADADQLANYQSELFWQQTAVELLGGEVSATKPLLKILMDKEKSEIAGAALLAIIKIGSPSVAPLAAVLGGKDAEMVEFAKAKTDGGEPKSYVRASAVALGAIGHVDARGPMIQALKTADDDVNRAVMTRELTLLPSNTDAEKAFTAGYEMVSNLASIWPSMFAAKPALLTASARFYDPEIVPWLLGQVSAPKADEELVSAGLGSAIRLMKTAQTAKVKIVVDKVGSDKDKSAFASAADLLAKCSDAVPCYLAKMKDTGADDAEGAFGGVKAAYMAAILGDSATGMEVVKMLPLLNNAEVRAAAVIAVDHAVQNDASRVADALEKMLSDEKSSAPGPLASTSAEQVLYRLRAR